MHLTLIDLLLAIVLASTAVTTTPEETATRAANLATESYSRSSSIMTNAYNICNHFGLTLDAAWGLPDATAIPVTSEGVPDMDSSSSGRLRWRQLQMRAVTITIYESFKQVREACSQVAHSQQLTSKAQNEEGNSTKASELAQMAVYYSSLAQDGELKMVRSRGELLAVLEQCGQ